jgi:hypothetical protein
MQPQGRARARTMELEQSARTRSQTAAKNEGPGYNEKQRSIHRADRADHC